MVDGKLKFSESFEIIIEPNTKNTAKIPDTLTCPKCKKGTIIKGKTAYGCSAYKTGCDYRYSYEDIKFKLKNKMITKELVYRLLNESI